jgi:hypothetical protein
MGDEPGRKGVMSSGQKLSIEVRQSLSLLAITALILVTSIGLGVLAGQIG